MFFQGCVNIFMMNSVGETLRYETWYLYYCRRSACILAKISQRNLIQMNFYISISYNIALKILARKFKYVWQLTGFYPLILQFYCYFFIWLFTFCVCYLFIFYYVLYIDVVILWSIKTNLLLHEQGNTLQEEPT